MSAQRGLWLVRRWLWLHFTSDVASGGAAMRRSRRPNVERMRRAVERDEVFRQARQREVWLASMTPEHRAAHERMFVRVGESLRAMRWMPDGI